MKRVGVYAGTFDPLHVGHVSFGRAALTEARLDTVYYVPERSPRHKQLATPYDTRVSTIVRTLHEYNGLKLLELPERALTVDETLPELTGMFPDTQLVLLFGADVVVHMPTWTHIDALVQTCEFAIGMRDGYARNDVVRTLQQLGIDPSRSTIIQTTASHVSSTAIRSETH